LLTFVKNVVEKPC